MNKLNNTWLNLSKSQKELTHSNHFRPLCLSNLNFAKINTLILKFVARIMRFWSLIFMLVRRHKYKGLVKHKNIINELFSHPLIPFVCKHHFVQNTYAHKKGFLGVPRTLWVLTPSLCVTNPLTCNLWHFISFDLKTSYFLGFVRTFSLFLWKQ